MVDERNGVEANISLGEMLDTFGDHGYKLWDAIFELVDNSVDSFTKYKKQLSKVRSSPNRIDIHVDNKSRTINVSDNAYGMSYEELQRALIPAKANIHQDGIGKYGMGLKTASSWLGKVWIVRTKQLGSTEEYIAKVNIPELKKSPDNFIPIRIKKLGNTEKVKNSSYTIIEITEGIRPYGSKAFVKTKQMLAIYYQRILDENFEIYWRGKKVQFEEPTIFSALDLDGKKQIYDFEIKPFEFKGQKISGRYGIYFDSSRGAKGAQIPFTGVTAFWRNRVILTRDRNWWPDHFFGGGAGNLVRQRLFLHLTMNDMATNAQKTDFRWDIFTQEQLERQLMDETNGHLKTISTLAGNVRKEKAPITQAERQLSDGKARKQFESLGPIVDQTSLTAGEKSKPLEPSQIKKLDNSDPNPYVVSINNGQPKLTFSISKNQHPREPFIRTVCEQEKVKVYINANHPFYSDRIGTDTAIYEVYRDFVGAISLSVFSSQKFDTVDVNTFIETTIDSYLRKLLDN